MQKIGLSETAGQRDSLTAERHSEGASATEKSPTEILHPSRQVGRDQGDGESIKEIKLISAAAGEKITIPAGWYHTTINLGRNPLILVNWLKSSIKNDYTLMEKKQGFGYYVVKSDTEDFELIKNNSYTHVPEAEFKIDV